jgi:uncharacterized membrane protein
MGHCMFYMKLHELPIGRKDHPLLLLARRIGILQKQPLPLIYTT